MNIDYLKPIMDQRSDNPDFEPHFRACECGQRFVIYGGWNFQTMLMIFWTEIKCPGCGVVGKHSAYAEDYQMVKN